MDYRAFLAAPLAALVLSAGATPAPLRMPDGWKASRFALRTANDAGDGYDIGIDDTQTGHPPALTLRSTLPLSPDHANAGRAYETITGYGGQRLRFSGQVRATKASAWAGLYMGLGEADVLAPLTGGEPGVEKQLPVGAAVPAADGAWHEVSAVLDVPPGTPCVGLGTALVGEGQFWVRDLKFEEVGPEVPVTTTPIAVDWTLARKRAASRADAMKLVAPRPLSNASSRRAQPGLHGGAVEGRQHPAVAVSQSFQPRFKSM